MICITCNKEHDEKFCPNCGERNGVKKLTLSSILEDTFISITDMDKGLLFNLKALILKPQKITSDYIEGKRKGILNPISFLILIVSFYLIVITLIKVPIELSETHESPHESIFFVIGKFIRVNLKFFWIFSILPLALSLKLVFKKYNFVEHLAISSFIIGQATLAGVVSYLVFKFPLIFDPIVYLVILWLVYKIFKYKNDKIESFLLAITVLILFILQLLLMMTAIGFIKA